jgi:hypothetical protein
MASKVEDEAPYEPGVGSAFLAILVMLVTSVVLFALIYGLMVAISPIETRERAVARPPAKADPAASASPVIPPETQKPIGQL